MKFAVANQFLMIADQAGVDYTNVLRAVREDYPRAADLPGPGFAAGPCLFKDTMQLAAFTSDHFPLGQAAMQVNEGLPAYIVVGTRTPVRRAAGQDRRDPGHGLQGRVGRHPGVAQLQAAQAPGVGRGDVSWRPIPTSRMTASSRSSEVLEESEILVLGAPHTAYRELRIGGRDVVDVWGALGEGIRL